MAAQGAMIAAQALRATQAVTSALRGSGDRDVASDELRTFMTMMLTGAPVLVDALQTRAFLETSQRLAAELARAIADQHARGFRCGKDKPIVLGAKGPGFSGPYGGAD